MSEQQPTPAAEQTQSEAPPAENASGNNNANGNGTATTGAAAPNGNGNGTAGNNNNNNGNNNNNPGMRRPRGGGRGGFAGPRYPVMPGANMRPYVVAAGGPGGNFRGGMAGGPRMNMGGPAAAAAAAAAAAMYPQPGMHMGHPGLPQQHQQQQQQMPAGMGMPPQQQQHPQQHMAMGQAPQPAIHEISTTNVYLKGLRSDTTDQFLRDLCKQYGPIKSAKAIVDRATQQCRGYGFVMFEAPESAQTALQGLQAAGYQVDFAKVTNNERANRPEQDMTNLYFSNLPLTFSEENLQALLQPYGEVGSCRILRDYYTGVSRGVGFARMGSTALCERIIQEFNGKLLEGATEAVQCKFADNPRSKVKPFAGGPRAPGGAFNVRAAPVGQQFLYPGVMAPMGYQDGQGGPRGNRMQGAMPPAQMATQFSPSYQPAMGTPIFLAQPQFVVGTLPFAVQSMNLGGEGAEGERPEEFYMYQAQ